jgi:transcription antitermination factor NusG
MPESLMNVSPNLKQTHLDLAYPPTAHGSRAWYALHVRSKHEFAVAKRLSATGIEHYLPVYRSLRQWTDRQVLRDEPLFSGYVFVQIVWTEKLRVVALPGVLSLLGTADSKVDAETIESIRRAIELNIVEPCQNPEVGDRVKVLAGPFKGVQGTLVRRDGAARLVIYLKGITQPIALHANLEDVQKL